MTAAPAILLLGTGSFAARVLFDAAATASERVSLVVAGRNRDRLDWLVTAANARAAMFGRPAQTLARAIDLDDRDATGELLATLRPSVVVQLASAQGAAVIAQQGNAWSRLVAEGGLSATASIQAQLTARVARAIAAASPATKLVNACFPDVVNAMLAGAGLPVLCGFGNVAILANAFAGTLPSEERAQLKLLAPYQAIAPWRRPAMERAGPTARAWLGAHEIADVYARFASVRLTTEPSIDISGASGVPLVLALAAGAEWQGHAPGPLGLPGGYPVALRDGGLSLGLPPGIDRDAAARWNESFEARSGVVVAADGRARYTGRLRELIHEASPSLAADFALADIEDVARAMIALRDRLLARPG